MWEQKKVNAPQTYGQNPLNPYGSGSQSSQLSSQLPPHMTQMSQMSQMPQMSPQLAQSQQMMGAFGSASLGPPPPYSPYPDLSSQQQPKYVPSMAYNPYQYVAPMSSASPYGLVTTASYAYPNTSQPQYQYNPYPTLPPNTTVVMPQGFDAGARFDHIARPPPPPGVAPNAAQLAAMQGQNSIVGQKKGSWLEGGSSGGYTFW